MSKNLRKEIKELKRELAYYKVYDVLWVNFICEKQLEDKTLLLGDIQERIYEIEPELNLLLDYYAEKDSDERLGMETYGYNTLEGIKGTIEYISDRWQCRFRVQWLLDLLDVEEKELNNG